MVKVPFVTKSHVCVCVCMYVCVSVRNTLKGQGKSLTVVSAHADPAGDSPSVD